MQVTLDLPDDISAAIERRWPDLPRQALEALAVEGYRTGALTEGQVRRLLGLETRLQVRSLLKDHRVPLQTRRRISTMTWLPIASSGFLVINDLC